MTHVAYDAVAETIYVRFRNGEEWWYGSSPQSSWDEFMAPMTSKGRYIHDILDGRPNGRVA
jgi:hypothetical protein